MGAALAIFFFSGISGLVYQVIWVRQFGNVFGNTVHSASLVTGVFMAGLGAGGYVLGRAADRRFRRDPVEPLRMYARAELAIAAMGLVLSLLVPRLGALSAAVSSYARGGDGWYELSAGSHALRYVVAIALIAPPTFLMGGTLTLLIRYLVGTDLGGATRRIGLLYGANTAGAALGAVATDFALVPAVGILGTQLVAAGVNGGAGILALMIARRPHAPAAAPSLAEGGSAASPPAEAPSPAGRRELRATSLALLLSGFAAMGLEILWFRVMVVAFGGGHRTVFSMLLAVILTGLWVGAIAGAWLQRKLGRPALLLLGVQCLLAASALVLLGSFAARALGAPLAMTEELKAWLASASGLRRTLFEVWATLRPMIVVTGVPAFLMGMSFPLANANVQRTEQAVGGRAGLLYLATTAGNVLGCALVGFVLLPSLGTQATALVLACAAAASAVPLFVSSRWAAEQSGDARERDRTVAVLAGIAVIVIAGFGAMPKDLLVRAGLPSNDPGTQRVLTFAEGLNETLAVVQEPNARTLFTNGHSMSGTRPRAQRYMRAFSHVPLLQMEAPERVLVICFGVGSTLHAASLHPSTKQLEVADLSRQILEHAHWFASTNHDVLSDPRVSVFVNDGRHHLTMQPEGTYDLITLEPPPITFAGVTALYSREFYELARSRLAPNGYLTQWLPAYQAGQRAVRAAVRAFVDVFPESVLLSGEVNELILMGTRGPSIQMDVDAVRARLAARPAVQADLHEVDLGDLKELAGTFAASHATMVAATKDAAPLRDDLPVLELGHRSLRMPRDLFDVRDLDAFCPRCVQSIAGLDDYMEARAYFYASDSFLVNVDPPALRPPPGEGARRAIERSRYLQPLFGGPAVLSRRTGVEHLRAGRAAAAIGELELAVRTDPRDGESFEWLGRALAEEGDFDAAARALDRAVRLAPERPSARFAFAAVLLSLSIQDAAAQQYAAGLELDPSDTDARYELAALLASAGRRDESERQLSVILDLDPAHPRANLARCGRAADMGDLDRAAAHCAEAATGGVTIPRGLDERLRAHAASKGR